MVNLFKIAHFCKTPSRAWPAWRPTRDVRIADVITTSASFVPSLLVGYRKVYSVRCEADVVMTSVKKG